MTIYIKVEVYLKMILHELRIIIRKEALLVLLERKMKRIDYLYLLNILVIILIFLILITIENGLKKFVKVIG